LEVLLVSLEGSALGQLMRTSGVWTYGLVNLVHILGVATLFGSVLILDLRLLGVFRQVPLAALERPTVPLAVVGFALAAISGACMISTNATENYGNPFLLIKFGAIALGLLNVAAVQFVPAWRARLDTVPMPRQRAQVAAVGGASLACWLAAVAAGRMVGFW
jgi:hypothetical protein